MENRFGSLIKNYDKITTLLGEDFLEKSRRDQLSADEFLVANKVLADECYGKEINEYLEERNIVAITDICQQYMNSLHLERYENVDFSNIGLIIVRPECFYIREQYKKFLKERNLEVIFEQKIQLDFRQYLLLYYDSFILNDTIFDFPSRTFNYINNDSYLLVVRGKKNINVSDFLYSIKGKQGKYKSGTLRGDIAYNHLKDYIKDDNLVKDAIIPLDPIGTARMLTRDKVPHDGSHNIANIPLMFYYGQAVHVPNSLEIKKDIVTLCQEETVEKILRKKR